MLAASDPDMLVAEYAIAGLILLGLWRLLVWLKARPIAPDPWESEAGAKSSETQDSCPHCRPQQPPAPGDTRQQAP